MKGSSMTSHSDIRGLLEQGPSRAFHDRASSGGDAVLARGFDSALAEPAALLDRVSSCSCLHSSVLGVSVVFTSLFFLCCRGGRQRI